MKSPIEKQVYIIKEVTLPSLNFQSKPHYGQCNILLRGELAKEVAFILCFVFILSKPILLSLMTCYLVSFCIVIFFVFETVSLFLKS